MSKLFAKIIDYCDHCDHCWSEDGCRENFMGCHHPSFLEEKVLMVMSDYKDVENIKIPIWCPLEDQE